MFCPSCGVKNEGGGLKCFVCGKILPSTNGGIEKPDRPVQAGVPRLTRSQAPAITYAAIGDRMLALLFDRLFLAAILGCAAIAIAVQWPSASERVSAANWFAFSGAVAAIVAILAYHILLEGLFGATLGKAILGLHVRIESGRGRFACAVVRNVFRLIDALALYAPAFLVAIFSKRKQRIGDYAAHAVVVEETVHWAARCGFLLLWAGAIAAFVAYAMSSGAGVTTLALR